MKSTFSALCCEPAVNPLRNCGILAATSAASPHRRVLGTLHAGHYSSDHNHLRARFLSLSLITINSTDPTERLVSMNLGLNRN